jgi:hypothetical protein
MYAHFFPTRHWKRRNNTYGLFGISIILCSTAFPILLIELMRYFQLLLV